MLFSLFLRFIPIRKAENIDPSTNCILPRDVLLITNRLCVNDLKKRINIGLNSRKQNPILSLLINKRILLCQGLQSVKIFPVYVEINIIVPRDESLMSDCAKCRTSSKEYLHIIFRAILLKGFQAVQQYTLIFFKWNFSHSSLSSSSFPTYKSVSLP